jgi:HEAT repeat protein
MERSNSRQAEEDFPRRMEGPCSRPRCGYSFGNFAIDVYHAVRLLCRKSAQIRVNPRFPVVVACWLLAAACWLAGAADAAVTALKPPVGPGGVAPGVDVGEIPGAVLTPDALKEEAGPAILWHADIDSALLAAAAEYKRVVVIATKPDCIYCQRLKTLLLPLKEVKELLARVIPVEVDIARNPRFAEQYRIQGVPTILVLSSDGSVETGVTGMPTRDALLDLLARAAGEGGPVARSENDDDLLDLLDGDKTLTGENWAALMAGLGSRGARDEIRDWLGKRTPTPAPDLVKLLDHPRLAVRLGAIETLEEMAGDAMGYDPWFSDTDPDERAASVAAWQAWASGTGTTARAAYSSLTVEQVDGCLRDLAGDDRTRNLRASRMLARTGPETVPLLDRFVEGHPDLGPGGRKRIREVRFALLLPRRRGLDSSGLAHRLVFGNIDVQLQAMRDLTRFGLAAEPILKEFLGEDDPLVRETAVDALVGACGEAAVPILVDFAKREKDSDVLIAVMRGLGVLGEPDAVPVLVSFLDHADEDMAIVALQSLGKLGNRGVGGELFACLKDARWRVRASALDTIGKLKLRDSVDHVEALLGDPEAFVRFKAVETLTEVEGKQSARRLRELFLKEDALKAPVLNAYCSMDVSIPDEFVAALDNADPSVLLPLLQVLEDHADKGLPIVEKLAAHPNPDVSCGAYRILARAVWSNPSVASTISGALRDGPREKQAAILCSIPSQSSRGSYGFGGWGNVDSLIDMAEDVDEGGAIGDLFGAFLGTEASTNEATHETKAAPSLGDLFSAFDAAPEADVGKTGGVDVAAKPPQASTPLADQIAGFLSTEDEEIWFEAALALLRCGRGAAVTNIEARIEGFTPGDRARIARDLEGLKEDAALSLLRKLLRDTSPEVRRAAAERLVENLPEASWCDALFEELTRRGTPLRPEEVYSWEFARRIAEGGVRRRVEPWIGKMLGPESPAVLARFALIVMEEGGQRRDAEVVARHVESPDPWTRRAALHALGRIDATGFAARVQTVAADSSDAVRIVVPSVFGKGVSDWVHVLEEGTTLSGSGYYSSQERDSFTKLSAATRSNVVAVLQALVRDTAPSVRFEAAMALLSRNQPVDLASVLSAAEALPDQRAVGERIGKLLLENYRRMDREFVVLLPYLRHGQVSPEKRTDIYRHFGFDPSSPDAAGAMAARLRESPTNSVALRVEASAEGHGPTAATAKVRLVFFREEGCDECAEVTAYLEALRPSFPELQVEELEIGSLDARDANGRFCRKFGVPDEYRLLTPAVFAGGGYLIRDDLTFDRLADLIVRSMGIPDEDWYAPPTEIALAGVVATPARETETQPGSAPGLGRWRLLLFAAVVATLLVVARFLRSRKVAGKT